MWRGVVRPEDADEYADYIRDRGSAYGETREPGRMDARCETKAARVHHFSLWESRTPSARFAGDDIETAVYCPEETAS